MRKITPIRLAFVPWVANLGVQFCMNNVVGAPSIGPVACGHWGSTWPRMGPLVEQQRLARLNSSRCNRSEATELLQHLSFPALKRSILDHPVTCSDEQAPKGAPNEYGCRHQIKPYTTQPVAPGDGTKLHCRRLDAQELPATATGQTDSANMHRCELQQPTLGISREGIIAIRPQVLSPTKHSLTRSAQYSR